MKALVYEGPRQMNLRDVEVPSLERTDVLVEVACSGICGSELSGYLGQNSLRVPPVIFGHEFAGTVTEVGDGVTRFKVGDRVTANPLATCGACRYCKGGRQQLCANRRLLSASLPGSNAQYVKVNERFVYALPPSLTFEQGALTEPVACAVRAVESAGVSPNHTVLVMGMGPIGQLILQVLRLHGVNQVMVADTNPLRLEQARRLGAYAVNPSEQDILAELQAFSDGMGVDAAFDAVGNNITRECCISAVTSGGAVVFTGLHEAVSNLPINDMIRKEIRTMGAFAYSTLNFELALRYLSEGRVGFQGGVVSAPLSEGEQWFKRLLGQAGEVTKVLLRPQD
ncbi:zinc-dependent alcohol dehydrogenase [Alicyclobacillus fodiniaquatilis]|uniref:Zinc-binding dehydrogenase n=1 Tax=Alicyclobacillus fodiniaquatilis TaxID=1661150 RepID=A0ABW4JJL4_9BACL